MVKRDRFLLLLLWLPGIGRVMLFLVYVALLWGLFFRWPLLPILLKFVLGTIFSFFVIVPSMKGFPKMEIEKQWRHVEELRMNRQDVPILEVPVKVDMESFTLPVVLTARLSYRVYVYFAIFWLLLAILVLFISNYADKPGDYKIVLSFWISLGILIIGFTGISMCQQIRITEQAIFLKRGIAYRKILWKDARLFAVIKFFDNATAPMYYELSSEDTILRWPSFYPPGIGFTTYPRTRAEYERTLNFLLQYIQSRVDLPLLDLR